MSSPTKTYATIYDVPATTSENPTHAEFATSTITLVNPPTIPPPHTPTPEPVHTPTEHPHLTIAPDSNTEEGKIISRVHHHNYPLSPQSSLNVMQGHPELDTGTLRTIAIGLANTAIGRTFQHLEAKSEIEQLRKELTDLRVEGMQNVAIYTFSTLIFRLKPDTNLPQRVRRKPQLAPQLHHPRH